MKKTSFEIPSCNGTDLLSGSIYLPDTAPRAILQICHGMCEYIGRYEQTAAFFCEQGFIVCGHDHVGHGSTAPSEDMLGFFGKKDGHRLLAQDAHSVSQYITSLYPSLPLFLLGHSMGSFVVRDYISSYGELPAGCVIMGTSGPNPLTGAGILVAQIIRCMRGPMYRSKLLQNLSFGSYTKKYDTVRTPQDWLTKDNAVVDAYRKDPKCHFIFTTAAFIDLYRLLQRINHRRWAASVPVTLPILLVSGSMDPVGDWGKGVQTVYHRLQAAGVENVSCILYPNGRHEILNDKERDAVCQHMLSFFNAQL